jgi:hypothetical protein
MEAFRRIATPEEIFEQIYHGPSGPAGGVRESARERREGLDAEALPGGVHRRGVPRARIPGEHFRAHPARGRVMLLPSTLTNADLPKLPKPVVETWLMYSVLGSLPTTKIPTSEPYLDPRVKGAALLPLVSELAACLEQSGSATPYLTGPVEQTG